jgi:hypothetical protein
MFTSISLHIIIIIPHRTCQTSMVLDSAKSLTMHAPMSPSPIQDYFWSFWSNVLWPDDPSLQQQTSRLSRQHNSIQLHQLRTNSCTPTTFASNKRSSRLRKVYPVNDPVMTCKILQLQTVNTNLVWYITQQDIFCQKLIYRVGYRSVPIFNN